MRTFDLSLHPKRESVGYRLIVVENEDKITQQCLEREIMNKNLLIVASKQYSEGLSV